MRGQSLLTMQMLAKSSTKLKASTVLDDAFGAWQFDVGSQPLSLLCPLTEVCSILEYGRDMKVFET